MISVDMVTAIAIVTQIGIGMVGNSSFLFPYIYSLSRKHGLRPIAHIISHLALANTLWILCGEIPQTMAAFGLQYFLDDVGCKLVFYFHRVAWGNSLSTTCLLGGIQALSVNLTNMRWSELKSKSIKHINSTCILSWVFHLLVNIVVPMRVTGQKSSRNNTVNSNLKYCSRLFFDTTTESVCLFIFSSIDIICLGFMTWAGGTMILFLHRHKQQVQYIRSTRQSPQTSPESRATKSILLLVSTFVLFYSLSSIFEAYIFLFDNPQSWLVNTSVILTSCFPTFSPFLLFKSNISIFHFCSSC
ncbi:vomeronasal type-1 receptor 4-like isoform X2 [Fukomys damarensis]|nr:vomeronasal type-1 receptor 4-like isoform X2 [Fukomys damarensis]XP_033621676.1 vomeronasal type-1 receptor 4-like isoform X2 [Fukomys damarensis]XP_033621677.1 vomeronasal type-1 receptor 4-like isoform X2 [Fukomys damarensis]